jgi:anthranilate phosphoribosyltransferase
MMLLQQATPAQIGAFMIAHRIKRPTAEELAGMLDAYEKLGPKLTLRRQTIVFGTPYDGRNRTAPVTSVTALMLAASGVPVILHGGDSMPTKYGIPLVEIWKKLGIDFTNLSLGKSEELLDKTGLTFFYLPKHFPEANKLVEYRDQIGKRPPFATLELIWAPSWNNVHIMAGFVHPPTEKMIHQALALKGVSYYTTIKGLEGSCDLPLSRTAIIGFNNAAQGFDRILLRPRDYGFGHETPPLESLTQLTEQMDAMLRGNPSPLTETAVWNGGFYLWHCGVCSNLEQGFALATNLLTTGKVREKLGEIGRAFSF